MLRLKRVLRPSGGSWLLEAPGGAIGGSWRLLEAPRLERGGGSGGSLEAWDALGGSLEAPCGGSRGEEGVEASGDFWRLLEASGGSWRGYWRLLEAPGDSWRLLGASVWRLLEASEGFWRLLKASGGFWRLLEAPGGFWRLLEAP